MSEEKSVLNKLELLKNWPLISHKKNVTKYLKRKINPQEKIIGILEGFFSDKDLNNFDTLGGVLVLTSEQLFFIGYEKNIQKSVPLLNINKVESQKKYSSVKLIFTANDYKFNFRSFFSEYKIKQFIEKIKKDYDIVDTPASTGNSDPLDRLLENSPLADLSKKLDNIIEKTSHLEKKRGLTSKDNLDFLFNEAKKIHELFVPILKDDNLKTIILSDLITLATLSTLADKKLNRNEAFFIILVLFDFNSNGSLKKLSFKKELFKYDHFQSDASRFIEENKDVIMNLLENQKRDNEEILKLHSLIYVQEYDKKIGSTFHDILISIYLNFTQCIIKADGTITEEEKTNLKNIQYLISHADTTTPKDEGDTPVQIIKKASPEKEETLDEVMAEINNLIGMKNIKDEINTFINLIKIQKERKEHSLPVTPLSLHAVFYGPPGTGKTTIARILGRIYKCLGLLKKGHLTETDRAGLVAGYVGQTAIKTDEVIQKSLDGILFIDEAYSLSPGRSSGQDFGQEAIDTILKRMEDYRERFVVIVAGYPDEMKNFITSNPGLKSRFSRYFYFNHYEPKQLLDIFYIFSDKAKFALDKKAEKTLLNLLTDYHTRRDKAFGNGRLVRNIFEKIIERQANRIAEITPLTKEILCTLKKEDIPEKEEIME